MPVRKYKAGKMLNKFLKIIARVYLKHLFDYSIDNKALEGIKPPYLILANHTNFWDPFLLSLCIPEPVFFVTSNAYFRNPVLKQLLKLVGAIPKTKLVSDPLSIRAVLEVVNKRGIIGVFPEGKRNWDGTTLPLLPPTAKLIKHLGIPVISVVFKGACLSMPRWASTTRKGSLKILLSKILDPEEIKSLSPSQIFQKISESLSYNEYEYQKKHMHSYNGFKKAEKLELFLFACPNCNTTDKLVSKGDLFCCSNCGYKVRFNTYGFFENDAQKLYFDNPRDWNIWQLKHLDNIVTDNALSNSSVPLFRENNITIRTGQKTGSLRLYSHKGVLSIYVDKIEYNINTDLIHRIKISDIIGENVQFNNQLELISNNLLFRFSGKNGKMPAYKWVKTIEILKKLSLQSKPSATI